MTTRDERDNSGLAVALATLALAAWVAWEAQSYTELAAVFPRTVALVMAGASVLLIVRSLLRLQPRSDEAGGSLRRRGLLAAVLIAWLVLIPVLGFFTASLASFLATGLTARYEPWPLSRLALFAGIGLVIVGSFYLLFAKVLLVPLPAGALL